MGYIHASTVNSSVPLGKGLPKVSKSKKVQHGKKSNSNEEIPLQRHFVLRNYRISHLFSMKLGMLETEFSQFSQQIEKSIFIGMAINPDGHWVLDGFHQSVL